MTPRQLLNAIRLKAIAAVIASDGDISYAEAKREATKQIAAENKNTDTRPAAQTPTNVSVHNARQVMMARLADVGRRISAVAGIEARASALAVPVIRKVPHTSDPESNSTVAPLPNNKQPDEPPEHQIVGGIFSGTSTATLIDDREFHTSLHDLTTQNWRRSLLENERRAKAAGKWIG
jgi:hypothetical protein